MKAALYVRTSTVDQTVDNQVCELEAVAERLGHEIVEIYADNGISGAKGRDRRPAFDRLCRDATRRRFDIIMAWSVDRLGRSLAGSCRLPQRDPRQPRGTLPASARA